MKIPKYHVCRKCRNKFRYVLKIDGKWRHCGSRKYCFDCAPFGKSPRQKLETYDTNPNRVCKICNKKFVYSGKNNKPGHRKDKCNSCKTLSFHKQKKLKAIAYLGGACEICGYDKFPEALCFHHKNGLTDKERNISRMYQLAWATLQKELDKCSLLCLNCHAEAHVELHKNGDESFRRNKGYRPGEKPLRR